MESIEELGAAKGTAAANLYNARERDGTHDSIRRALPDAVKAAKADAAKLQDNESEDQRAVAIYWASFAEAFEAGIKH
jgi:hypothetical protein